MTPEIATAKKKLVVIGGGAAGFFCAVNAARLHPHLEVLLLEKTNKVLSKVKVSGGGRCNVTHACFSISEMIKKYPRGGTFLKKAFHQFFTTDTIRWFEERGVPLKTEADGRMFPETNTSQSIVDCLLREASKYKVVVAMQAEVKQISANAAGSHRFSLSLSSDKTIDADTICIASGGYPKTAQFHWLSSTGHELQPPVPSLFTFNIPNDPITKLMGISVEDATVKIAGSKLQQSGPLLVTHWGLSGPAVLKMSAWAARELADKQYRFSIIVNWLPAYNEQTLKEKLLQVRLQLATQKVINRNPFRLPSRLWDYFLQQCEVAEHLRWAELPAKAQNMLAKMICAQEFSVQGKTTFKEEFVTAGGIALHQVDVNTMQSRLVPGLYFAGEVLDVDGVTGGFNFQNAWTTAYIAALAAGQ